MVFGVKVAQAESITGRLVLGPVVYEINGTVLREANGALRMAFTVSQNETVIHSIDIVLTSTGGRLKTDNAEQLIPVDRSELWRGQLETGFWGLAAANRFIASRGLAGELIYDSPGLIELTNLLPGRLRLIYAPNSIQERRSGGQLLVSPGRKLGGLRFFSLAEWNNIFLDYVALSLEFR